MATAFIKIKNLDRNGLQTRAALNEATVTEYTEAMDAGVEFPPVTVFREDRRGDSSIYRLADGFHRVEAKTRTKKYGKPGFDTVKATIISGGYSDALKFALGANAAHGLRRTNADKRHALEMAWEKRKELFGGEPSNGALAKMCGVSERTVASFRADQPAPVARALPVRPANRKAPPPPPPTKRVGVDGVARAVPVRPAPVRPPVKKGYHIGPDGKQHADGVILDQFGVEIPERIKPAFFNASSLKCIISQLQTARMSLKQAQEKKDVCIAAVSQRAGLEMENAYHELKAAIPYCVCRMCQGQGCDACRETGFQTEDQFKRNPPEFNP